MKILLLENINSLAGKILIEAGHDVELLKTSLPTPELKEKLSPVNIVGVRSATTMDRKMIEENKNLVAIGAFCIGVNNIDCSFAASLGIPIFNSPFSSTRSVAELVLAQIINLARGVGDNLISMKANRWEKSAENKFEIRGKTLSILGFGHIGTTLSMIAEGLGMKILFYDIEKKLEYGNAKRMPDLDSCLENADFVTLHVPLTNLTYNMIGEKQIRKMKRGSYLLNASRGEVVNIRDVVAALKDNHLAGFYADVFPYEPKKNGEWLTINKESKDCKDGKICSDLIQIELLELTQMKNVILTSHIGGNTTESQEAIAQDVSEKLLSFLSSGNTKGCVNLPQLSLPPRENCWRILNFHRNVPGVMKEFDSCLTRFNIVQQTLSTLGEIGYCITDIEKSMEGGSKGKVNEEEVVRELNEEISKLPHTLRNFII